MEELIIKAKSGHSEAFIEAMNMCTEMLYKLGVKLNLNDEDIANSNTRWKNHR